MRKIKDDKTELRKIEFKDKDFKKSSYTPAYPFIPYQCVMVAKKGGAVAIRDSKDVTKKTLIFNEAEWDAFTKGVKAGEFDR